MRRTHKKDDYFESGKPVHRISCCAFLDVLGFAARIHSSHKNKKADELLQKFHKIFKRRLERLNPAGEASLYIKSFSDNVLLAQPRFSEDLESEFAFVLMSVSEYQFEMALEGFFIRGGFSVGPLFVDDNSVYGQALIEAYELESKVAVNPIVVLSNNMMKLVDKHLTYYGGTAPQVRDVLVNADGRYFINYLSECILEPDDREELDIKGLKRHKKQIESALKQYVDQPAVFAKFSWLSAYHNFFCESVSTYPEYSDKVKINIKLSTVKFETLAKKPIK